MKKPRHSMANSLENSGLGIGCQLVVGRSTRCSENRRTVELENWRTVKLENSVTANLGLPCQAAGWRFPFLVPCSLFLVPDSFVPGSFVPLFLVFRSSAPSYFRLPIPTSTFRLPLSDFRFPLSDFRFLSPLQGFE